VRIAAFVLFAGCGAPDGARVEISASGASELDGTGYVRTIFPPGGDLVREVRWDGADPFVFQVLVDAEVTASEVEVQAIGYPAAGGEPIVNGSFIEYVVLEPGAPPFRVEGAFE
jgi:hypothetical protein